MAAMTTQLSEIAAAYGTLTARQKEFISAHAHLSPALATAIQIAAEVFGAKTKLSLYMLHAPYLYILIHTALSYQEAEALGKEFKRRWVASVPSDVHSLMTWTLEFEN